MFLEVRDNDNEKTLPANIGETHLKNNGIYLSINVHLSIHICLSIHFIICPSIL